MATNTGPGGKGESPMGDAAIAGEVSERMTGDPDRATGEDVVTEDDADEARLEQLPEHERDADTSVGAGLTSSGVMAEQRGEGDEGAQPFDSDDEEADADR
jgi:hypothetical protein